MSASEATAGLPLPRWALWLMLPGIVCPILIFGFIIVTQLAHDPERCPYAERSRRPIGTNAFIVEASRTCLPQVEERRFTLVRGPEEQVLGTRRLRASAFAKGYRWSATRGQGGEVSIVIHNEGYGELTFREGTAQEKSQR